MRTTVHLPDDLAAEARCAGLNVSALVQDAVVEALAAPADPLLRALDALVEGREIGEDLELGPMIELARALARRIDGARGSRSAAAMAATAMASRELRSVLEPLTARGDERARELVASMFAGTGVPSPEWP